jgi:hypothetical protein
MMLRGDVTPQVQHSLELLDSLCHGGLGRMTGRLATSRSDFVPGSASGQNVTVDAIVRLPNIGRLDVGVFGLGTTSRMWLAPFA